MLGEVGINFDAHLFDFVLFDVLLFVLIGQISPHLKYSPNVRA